jgi:hypothetical protein
MGFGWVFGCGGLCFVVGCVVMACLKGFYASKQQVFRNPLKLVYKCVIDNRTRYSTNI